MEKHSDKQIAKNAAFLYLRMVISIVVTLFTSRVVLNTLGVEDFGIYGLVGGIVIMFNFLNASMSGATSRFLTFAIGEGNTQKLKDTFSTSLLLHLLIGLVVIVVAEPVGVWFVNFKLDIPEERIFAANVVFQFSILSMFFTIMQVPFNASIISHERMGAYAYIEIINVILKLLIVYILLLFDIDKLILYSILISSVAGSICIIYVSYCLHHFSECRLTICARRDVLRPMLSFSGWDLYGNMCVSLRQQGLNIIINLFFGVLLNAASTIATQVVSAINGLASNSVQAFRPQIIKQYAMNSLQEMEALVNKSIILSGFLYLIVSVPLFLGMDQVLFLWLGNVPDFAIVFCKISLVTGYWSIVNSIIIIVIHATGRVTMLSFIEGTVYLISLFFVYLSFIIYGNPAASYYVGLGVTMLNTGISLIISKRRVPVFSYYKILISLITPFLIGSMSVFLLDVFLDFVESPNIRIILYVFLNTIFFIVIGYNFVLDKLAKDTIKSKVVSIINIIWRQLKKQHSRN